MPKKDSGLADVFIQALGSLKKKERDEFLEKLLDIKEYREDLIDRAIIEMRKNEPKRPLRDYLAERKKKAS